MQKVAKVFSIILFFGLITAPLLSLPFQDLASLKKSERMERRRLARIPETPRSFDDLLRFPSRFERYFDDNFGFRLALSNLHSKLRFHLFRSSPRGNVIIGREGWFFRGKGSQFIEGQGESNYDAISAYLGATPFSEKELLHWKRVLEKRHNYLAKRGVKYIFSVAPLKSTVYPEHLPGFLGQAKGLSRGEQLIRYMRKNSYVPVVDFVQPLEQAKARGEDLFLKTDGHWNQMGALVAYQSIMKKAQELFPDRTINIAQRSDFELKYQPNWHHKGFSSLMGFRVPEPFPSLEALQGTSLSKVFERMPPKRKWQELGFYDPFLDDPYASIADRMTPDEEGEQLGERQQNKKKKLLVRVSSANSEKTAQFSYTLNPHKPALKVVQLQCDSFLRKALHYFAANTEHLLRSRTELGFDTSLFESGSITLNKPELVVQEVAERYLVALPN